MNGKHIPDNLNIIFCSLEKRGGGEPKCSRNTGLCVCEGKREEGRRGKCREKDEALVGD